MKYSISLEKKLGVIAISLYLAAVGFAGYGTHRLNKKFKRLVELKMLVDLLEETKKNTDGIEGIYEKTKMLRDYSEFEQDPDKWSVLGLPEGSHIEGEYKKGGDYKVITPVNVEKFAFVQPVIKGPVDLVGVRMGNGTYYGKPGESIDISFTSEEMEVLKSGGKVPYQVMGISAEDRIITGSFANGSFEMKGE
ncbi:MAG: hypothetical protein JSV39_00245 [Candidatus Aenigmatarchaeota archaeon]|nr:MAG: hypothetical protein JSV39_00245 [Candidatus Aenigmarchaeota archaeon]